MSKKDKMDIVLIIIGCIIVIAAHLIGQRIEYNKNIYEVKGTIYSVEFKEGVTLLKTEDGNIFGMKGTETWPKGTAIVLTMNSQGTKTVIDDAIIALRRQ